MKTHIIFTTANATSYDGTRVTYGVFLDLDELQKLAFKAAKNKSRKAKDGALHVEVHQTQKTA